MNFKHTLIPPTHVILTHLKKYKHNFGVTDAETVAVLEVLPNHCFSFRDFLEDASEICDIQIKIDVEINQVKFILGQVQSLDKETNHCDFDITEKRTYTDTVYTLNSKKTTLISYAEFKSYITKLVTSKTQTDTRYAICNGTITIVTSAPKKKSYYVVKRHKPKAVQSANKSTKHKQHSENMRKNTWLRTLFGTNE